MSTVLILARLLLILVFAVSGVSKLADRAGTRQAINDFGVPSALAAPFGILLPLAELAVAVALIPPSTALLGAVGALGLLLLFILGISYNLARGRRPDCRCFGQLHSAPVGWRTLLRNGGLAVVAGYLVRQGRGGGAGPGVVNWMGGLSAFQAAGIVAAVILAGLLVVQWWFLFHLMRQNGRLLVRVESLEEALVHGGSASPNGLVTGLPVGAPAPDFELPEIGGGTLSLASLRAAGKPVLLIFTDPECGPCAALLPEVGLWQRKRGDVEIALVSRGDPGENRAQASAHELRNFVLQEDWEVADAYGVIGTPSAIFVSPDGSVGSALAAGVEPVNDLVLQVTGAPEPGA